MPGRTVCVTFLSTLSLRRATRRRPPTPAGCGYFYPRSPCGERPTRPRPAAAPRKFLSTLSLRRATARPNGWIFTEYIFLSTLSLRRATHEKRLDRWPIVFLSTLSLRRATSHRSQEPLRPEFLSTLSLRRATILGNPCAGCPAISIHALLAESDQLGAVISTLVAGFLSTLSLRRATQQQQQRAGVYGISIHALLAESDNSRHYYCLWNGISIHALLAESDVRAARLCSFRAISIHALLAESDGSLSFIPFVNSYFYPRSPCGERR